MTQIQTPDLQPCNIEAEQIILGTILSNNNIYYKVSEIIEYYHFYEPVHQKIYRQTEKLINKGLIANAVTLKNTFKNEPALEDYGKEEYLSKLVSLASLLVDINSYANAILECYLRRQLINMGSEIVHKASNEASEESAKQQIEDIESNLIKLDNNNTDFVYISDLGTSIIERLEFKKKNPNYVWGIETGYTDLDKYIESFKPAQLIVIAARPGMGKTAFAINLILNCLDNMNMKNQMNQEEKQSVGLFSLEMSAREIAQRMLSFKTEIPKRKYDNNLSFENDKYFRQIVKANKEFQEYPIVFADKNTNTINQIKNKAKILKRRENLGILFIDYLQLIKGTSKKGDDNRTQEITQITQELKALAKELEIPIIALSQLSRKVEDRKDKTPQLADLRESGSIEQDADVVMFIHRQDYYTDVSKKENLAPDVLQKIDECKNQADIIISKQRDGPVGNLQLYFDPETNKFKNLTRRNQ